MASFQVEVVNHLLALSPLSGDDQAIMRDTLLDAAGQAPQDALLAQRILDSLLAYLQPRASLSRLEDTVIRKLVCRLHQESEDHGQVARGGEEAVPDTSKVTTGKEVMRVDAPPMGEDVQTSNDKGRMTQASSPPVRRFVLAPDEVLEDEKKQPSAQAVTAGDKNVKQEHPGQAPTPGRNNFKQEYSRQVLCPNGNSLPLSDYMKGVENEQPYQFGMKHMQKHGWALGEGLGPQGSGIREFLEPIPNQNNHGGLPSDAAPTVKKGRGQKSSRDCIRKDTVAMPDGKRYDAKSTPRHSRNTSAGAEYGEPEWQSGFPFDDPYLRKSYTKHAAWAKNGW